MAIIKDLSQLGELELDLHQNIESHEHDDENSADTRLFVWNFSPDDVKLFVGIFERYNVRPDNSISRNILNGELQRQCNAMLIEKCNPVECMLYASKVSNSRFNDELIDLLAARIKTVYDDHPDETVEVLQHIFDRWTWAPQRNAAIIAVGLIGKDEELLDSIYPLVNDNALKRSVFRAFVHRKSQTNLGRAMDVVISLRGNEDIDRELGEIFIDEFNGFASIGIDTLKEYLNGSYAITRYGFTVLNKIARNVKLNVGDNYIDNLATLSRDDDEAYNEFLDVCHKRNDEYVTFRCRFSRREIISDFLEPLLKSDLAAPLAKNNAIVSIAQLSCGRRKGTDMVAKAKEIIREHQQDPDNKFACMASLILLGDGVARDNFMTTLCHEPANNLSELYWWLSNASVVKMSETVNNLRRALHARLVDTFRNGYYVEMENLASNLRIFKSRNLGELITKELLDEIKQLLRDYVENTKLMSERAVTGLIDVGVRFDEGDFTRVLFMLYEQRANRVVKGYARKVLLRMDTLDPIARARIR